MKLIPAPIIASSDKLERMEGALPAPARAEHAKADCHKCRAGLRGSQEPWGSRKPEWRRRASGQETHICTHALRQTCWRVLGNLQSGTWRARVCKGHACVKTVASSLQRSTSLIIRMATCQSPTQHPFPQRAEERSSHVLSAGSEARRLLLWGVNTALKTW